MNPDCRAIRDLLPMTLLGEAGEGETARIERHLQHCTECRTEAKRHSLLLGVLSATEVPDPGPAYWISFLPRLKGRISRERAPAVFLARGQGWAVAASVALFILGAAGVVSLQPSAEDRSRMALSYIAARTSPDTLTQALDEVLPGSESSRPVKAGGAVKVPGFAELQRALDSLLPPEEGDPGAVGEDLSPQARSWLLKTLMPDRV